MSICTNKRGTKYIFTEKSLSLKERANATEKEKSIGNYDAGATFETDNRMYKADDYRCLKPIKGVPSSKWPHYEMDGFRKAKTKRELKAVAEIPFDKYFFNFEDPKVFEDMTDSRKGSKIWEKTFGFDKVMFQPGNASHASRAVCYKHCKKMEHRKFAKQCTRNGGLFKCCISR